MSRSSIDAIDIANVFLKLTDQESGDVLTNLKLQKLAYYSQGFHLALYNKPLFDEEFVAWEHGPVVRSLYDKLKNFGSEQVIIDEPIKDSITEQQKQLISEINKVYGQFSAWKLRDMTHNESPWLSTAKGATITNEKLKTYFKTQLQA